MAAVLKHTYCPACGHRHHFFVLDGPLSTATLYKFHCPETGRHSTLKPSTDGEQARFPPQGAVALTPVAHSAPAAGGQSRPATANQEGP
jgi:hypothetical protein